MKISMRRKARLIKQFPSSSSSRHLSDLASIPPPEAEGPVGDGAKPFRFLNLPSELRNKIYEAYFNGAPLILDLDPDNYKSIGRMLPLFLVSKQVHEEASHYFYSTHTIRLFPTHPGRFFKTRKPLLARLPPRYRDYITSFQLRLGPGFTNPPRGWVVNEALGLRDATSVRLLTVFVEVDTSNPIFEGFRRNEDGFYEMFSRNLLDGVLTSVPSIIEVQFDAYLSVQKDGNMMRGLLEIANKHRKFISWGLERGWNEQQEASWADDVLTDPPTPNLSTVITEFF